MKKYDVVIAGAGLAGLSLAWKLAGSGLSALVLDKKQKAGHVEYHSSGTFMQPEKFGLPRGLMYELDEVAFCSKNESCVKKVRDCFVIDRIKLYNWLLKRISKDKNIKIALNCGIKKTFINKEKIRLIEFAHRGRIKKAEGNIFVDCTGLTAALGRAAGLTPQKCVMALGHERLVPLKNRRKRAYLYVGGNLGGGYGWIFPKGPKTAIAGAGVIRKELSGRIEQIFTEMWEARGVSGQCLNRPVEKHFAVLRTGKPLYRLVKGNLMVLGDSAMQANPLIGEGIRFIMDGAGMAADAIKASAAAGRTETLHDYEKQWIKKYLKKYRFAYFMQKVLREITMNDWILDKGVKVLRCCSEEDYRRVISADISLAFLMRIAAQAIWKLKVLHK